MLDFISNKIKTYIIYGLFSLLLATVASHMWCYFEKESAKADVETLNNIVQSMHDDIARAVTAEKSCKRSIKKLIDTSRKKQKVINTYKKQIKKGEVHEKINSVNDFINFAERLQ